MASDKNKKWDEYETALLICMYLLVKSGQFSKDEAVRGLSKMLRKGAVRLGEKINDTYRNENGISFQFDRISYCFTGIGKMKPNAMFVKMAEMYKNDTKSFGEILSKAMQMYSISPGTDTNTPAEQNKIQEETQGESESDNKIGLSTEQTKKIIQKYFPKGYKLNSFLDFNKFKSFYKRDYGEDLNVEMDVVHNSASQCGITYSDRVYLVEQMLNGEAKEKLIGYIGKEFENGAQCVYYTVVFDNFKNDFYDGMIYSADMLKSYLTKVCCLSWNFESEYITCSKNVKVDVTNEVVEYVKNAGGVVTEDEVVRALYQYPEDKIRISFERAKLLLGCGKNQKFHIKNFVFDGKDIVMLSDMIRNGVSSGGFISVDELYNDLKSCNKDFVENNIVFGEIGMRNFMAAVLGDTFCFYKNLISSKKNPMKTSDALEVIAKRQSFTLDDLDQLAKEFNTSSIVYIESCFKYSVRIDSNHFVAKDLVHFDVEGTDNMLEKFFKKDYVAIKEVSPLDVLPECGYKWNYFLLESYVVGHSEKFKLIHSSFCGKTICLSGIVKKNSNIKNFIDLAANEAADSGIELTENNILDLLYMKGYISIRRFRGIDKIVTKAVRLRNESLTLKN